MKASEIENLVAYQIGALQAIATMAGHKVTHVKAHGALSNVACEDDMTARAIASAIKAVDRDLIFVVLANSRLVQAGEAANLPMVHEVFADRAYEDDGSLVSRRKPGAVLHDATRSRNAWCGWCRMAPWCQSRARLSRCAPIPYASTAIRRAQSISPAVCARR